ncbi:MAG: twin-arginine translocation signal domain-containing protein [Gemmatimonadota bacterium]
MTRKSNIHQPRRDFLTQLGVATAALAGSAGASPLVAQWNGANAASQAAHPKWDTSWTERLTQAQYRVVFDASNIADGFALDLAGTFLDHYKEAHGTNDAQTRAVLVMRQLGTPLALGDALWDKFAVGEELKMTDRNTGQPARRNPFFKARSGGDSPDTSLETLYSRGTIFLLCNIAMNNWSRRHAELAKRPVDEVVAEVRANLVPGTIVVPSGIYALIHAQNLGCAFMRGA